MDVADQKIRQDIIDELTGNQSFDITGLEVVVAEQHVSVSGKVPAEIDKIAIENRISEIPGVLSVDNHIQVSDIDQIAQEHDPVWRIEKAFLEDEELAVEDLGVKAGATALELSGTVDSEAMKARAGEIASQLAGFKRVENNIAVVPATETADAQIARALEEALDRNSFVAAENVNVRVEDRVVYLSGEVSTWQARNAAYSTAASISGVERVEDELGIVE